MGVHTRHCNPRAMACCNLCEAPTYNDEWQRQADRDRNSSSKSPYHNTQSTNKNITARTHTKHKHLCHFPHLTVADIKLIRPYQPHSMADSPQLKWKFQLLEWSLCGASCPPHHTRSCGRPMELWNQSMGTFNAISEERCEAPLYVKNR